VFEGRTIQRMELLVLSTLKWRMQAVTPFSYIDYFLHRLNGGDAPSKRSVVRSADLILCIARGAGGFSHSYATKSLIVSLDQVDNFSAVRVAGTQCLDFRPSEIAVAVATVVAGEERAADIDEACTHRVHKVRVWVTHATFDASQRTSDL
jgi:cyclin D1/2/4, plant